MRVLLALLLLSAALAPGAALRPAKAAPVAPVYERAAVLSQAQADEDDDTVEVQIAVLAAAVVVVVGVGTAGYLLRKRLGLVAPPPEQGADAHH